MRADLDVPTFKEWERRRGVLDLEPVGQVGIAHERTAEQPQPAPMRWTSEPPTEPGWYWNRHRNGENGIPVYVFSDGFRLFMLDPSGKAQVDVRARWQDLWSSAPISEPEDA